LIPTLTLNLCTVIAFAYCHYTFISQSEVSQLFRYLLNLSLSDQSLLDPSNLSHTEYRGPCDSMKWCVQYAKCNIRKICEIVPIEHT
jgi:hypothetical protein